MRIFLLIIFLTLHLKVFSQVEDSSAKKLPNIVLIVANGHGVTDLGCYGNLSVSTSSIDKLASEGIRFYNFFDVSACRSSNFAVILTGMYGHASGQYGQAFGANHFSVFGDIKNLTWYLKKAGYRTARTGIFPLQDDSCFEFDNIIGQNSDYRNTFTMAENCTGFIAEKRQSPFFLLFCPADPDRSYEDIDISGVKSDRFGNREEGYDGVIPKFYNPDKMNFPGYIPDFKGSHQEYSQYAQSVTRLDLGIGRLMFILHKNERWDNTLVIYLSSTGPSFPGVQNNLYLNDLKLPLIVKLPYIHKKNEASRMMVSCINIMPTILDFSGALPSDNSIQGRSLKQMLVQGDSSGWDEIYASHTFDDITSYYPMRSIINRNYQLIWNIAWKLPYNMGEKYKTSATWSDIISNSDSLILGRHLNEFVNRPEFELYDIKNDPAEIVNLSSNPLYIGILEELKLKIKDFQVRTNDPWIICK